MAEKMICKYCKKEVLIIEVRCPYCQSQIIRSPFFLLLTKFDEIFAGLCLSAMIIIVLTQIFLRNFYQTGISGADPLVRHLVLWVVFLGAGIAAKDNSHIKIDLLSKKLPNNINKIINFLVSLFSTIVLGILIYAAMTFVSMEYTDSQKIPLMNIPVWTMEIIIPAGYTIVAIHTLINGIKSVLNTTKEI